jgi:hypothetical protein
MQGLHVREYVVLLGEGRRDQGPESVFSSCSYFMSLMRRWPIARQDEAP